MSSAQERQAGTSGSTQTGYEPGQTPSREYAPVGRHEEHRGAVVGFTAVAGTLMVIGGLWSVVVGIVALSTNHIYVTSPSSGYTFRWTLNGWGWGELILGIVVFAAGVSVFLGMMWARIVGAVLAVISAVANFVFLPYAPIWAIIMIALDAFIVWALLVPRRVPGEM
ncbi:MAG: hypothetical protein M0030_00030 [Actinomycetota bacterium]|jgi:hypothetical protein|nr:hypothetical protein [Actinomycetota bacterium]